VPLDEPFGVVAVGELGDGLTELIEGGVGPGPQALLLQRADERLGAAVGANMVSRTQKRPRREAEALERIWPVRGATHR